jgi:hypothetical protein
MDTKRNTNEPAFARPSSFAKAMADKTARQAANKNEPQIDADLRR